MDSKSSKKRSAFKQKRIIFHQDNACVFTMAKLNELTHELLEHLAYSPHLTTPDYYMFPDLKIFLPGVLFTSNDEAIAIVNGYFRDLP